MIALGLMSCGPAAPEAPARESDPARVPEPARSVFDQYLKISESLAADSMKGVAEEAAAMAEDMPKQQGFPTAAAPQAEALAKAESIAAARKAFQPLSQSMEQYLRNKNIKGAYYVAYCPMVKATWLQTTTKIRNPYYGKSMLDCGEIRPE